ncbi:pilus assembly protein [Deferribacter abyssi]|uniref:pilus assembly protein n=1 Tax=Deferribacter abyssi TaxID=213806 RepID=UPI003C1DB25A
MKKFMLFLLLLLFFVKIVFATTPYDAIPPFIVTGIKPNVLLLLDNSGSMNEFAYKEKYDYRSYSNNCSLSALVYYGYDNNKNYYGLFDSTKWYSYDNSKQYFYLDSNGKWYGNFLNWLVTRRTDVVKKILTGGKYVIENNNYVLVATSFDRDYRKILENNVSLLTPHNYTDGAYFYFYTDNKDFVYFDIRPAKYNSNCWVVDDNPVSYRVAIKVDVEPQGLIHTTSDKLRYGLMFFNNDSGGYVKNYLGDNYNDIISAINNVVGTTWTPLAETLFEASRYLRAMKSAFNRGVDYALYDPIGYKCRKNFIIILTDGESTMDEEVPNSDSDGWDKVSYREKIINNNDNVISSINLNNSGGTWDLVPLSFWMHTNDLRSDLDDNQTVTIYTVFAFDNSDNARQLLKLSAKYGGFYDLDGNNIPNSADEYDLNGDGNPDTYFEANEGYSLEKQLGDIFTDIITKVASGTSVAVLTDKRKEGSLIAQAVFYPNFDNIPWIGKLFGYWFLNFKNKNNELVQNIREDTNNDYKLNICGYDLNNNPTGGDLILSFNIDSITNKLSIIKSPSDCLGKINDNISLPNGVISPVDQLEDISYLFEVSDELSNIASSGVCNNIKKDRVIYTQVDNKNLIELKNVNNNSLFGSDLGCLTDTNKLIDFTYGCEVNGCLSRRASDGKHYILGDIVYSTPQILDYDNISMVFVAANDGMLHAFRLGKTLTSNENNVAVLLQNAKDDAGNDLIGYEEWAFIPQNALPYLRYRAQPDLKHLYINDLTPYIVQIGTKRMLIGGMRMGGASDLTDNVTGVTPPSDTSPLGKSVYYALDITDPLKPKFLWEFTDDYLGFTYPGPALIRTKNGNYVMFISGMKDYNGEHGFTGDKAKVYILKLNDDLTIDSFNSTSFAVSEFDSSMKNNEVFGNRLFTNGVDFDGDGYTDAVFFAFNYIQAGDWTANLYVLKIDNLFPSVSSFDRVMSSLHGAVTASIVYMPCFNMDYIYFGTGKWFYKTDDNLGRNNKLYGINISCLRTGNCNFSSAVNNTDICNELTNQTQKSTVVAWEVGLNTAEVDNGTEYGKERVIADTGIMPWANTVLFTSMQPSLDPCSFGGRSRGWGLNCATGRSIWDTSCSGYVVDNTTVTCGYLQSSTAAIYQLCKETFSNQEGDRAVSNAAGNGNSLGGDSSVNNINAGQTRWYSGITPETPPIIPSPFSGLKGKILLWIEK